MASSEGSAGGTRDTDRRVLLLAPGDNIAVASAELAAGTQLRVAGRLVVLVDRIDIGHKFAVRDIARGERILKYSAPIGSATHAIAAGEYVHTHNLASDYLPTYLIEDGSATEARR